MKFSRKKFISLTKERQKRKITLLIDELYLNYQKNNDISYQIEELKNLISWYGSDNESLNKLSKILQKNDFDFREFDKAAIPFLMENRYNVQDHLEVYSQDFLRKDIKKFPLILVLDNLRSLYNVGAIFRSAECFGVSKIYCVGYTPTPKHKGFSKTAMGTEKLVSWEKWEEIDSLISKLKTDNVYVYALELTSKSKNLNLFQPDFPCAIVLGNEALGLSKKTLMQCNEILHIPLFGAKNSLNVSSAAAIALNHFSKKYFKEEI